ncbi:MAG: TetR/AcrR family transcriptional regulator [Clostridium sp.]
MNIVHIEEVMNMPKILDNPQERILVEARKILSEHGYKNFSMRDLSKRANMALGTIYNYYDNKDSIVNSIFSTHWDCILEESEKISYLNTSLNEKLTSIYELVEGFLKNNMELFLEINTIKRNSNSCGRRDVIIPLCTIVSGILSKHRALGEVNNSLNDDKLAQLIIHNMVIIIRDPFITFQDFLSII